MTIRRVATAVVVAAGLTACAGAGEDEQTGTLLGAVIGGVAGAQVGEGDGQLLAVGIGTLIGAMVGGEIGRTMDEVDRQLALQTTERALEEAPRNTTTEWQNPDTGNYGTITPLNTTEPSPGIYCREFQHTVTIGGQTEDAFGTACRQPDGTWEIQQG